MKYWLSFASAFVWLPAAAIVVAPAAPIVPSPTANMFQVMFGLILVLGLMAGAAWLLKRFATPRTGAGTPIKIVGGVSVGSRERVMVVEVADQWIVVGVAAGRVSALATMPRQENASAPVTAPISPTTPNFAAWLKNTLDKRTAEKRSLENRNVN